MTRSPVLKGYDLFQPYDLIMYEILVGKPGVKIKKRSKYMCTIPGVQICAFQQQLRENSTMKRGYF